MKDLILFSGMGGATDGLVRAGWDPAACVDGWEAACVAHRRWHPALPVVQARIEAAPVRGPFRFVWASPSCKPWSTANRTPSRGKQHREYYSLARLVRQAFEDWRARWLVIENVGGLIWSKEGVAEIAELRAEVERHGLALSMPRTGTIPSNTLGVAQLRRRVFLIVGPRLVSIRPGSALLPPAGTPPMLWEQCECWDPNCWHRKYGDPPSDAARAGPGVVANEWGRVNGAARLRARRGIVDASPASRHAKWNRTDAPVVGGKSNGREAWGRAERAVEAGEHQGRQHTRGKVLQAIGRTLAECAALQQVPMAPLAGFSKRVAHELVGNCVPPPVAEHIGRIVLEADAAMEAACST